ncbi:LuxR family transcriptional regulator [Paractinoplanes ferrugineus]|uniref:LuxR family transcriptional regulator n=1 Tax=Paractinoplanes ferrugineus TaxID=113564 RepID=A0A919J300_9ACTN|nr:LuxR family transcriptional regulator [Actinoplanes ferrugineus]GIE13841.1 LuxR family transcriptional regulator [Actinoplanes ferrugineus]
MTAQPVAVRDGLVGRGTELALLDRVIGGIEHEGASLLVRGQPGVGKSSILRAAAETARHRGALVLPASGVESEAMLPFSGLHQLLLPLMSGLVALPPVQHDALSTAFGAMAGPPPELFLTALAALTLITDAAGSRPVVLVVDDVQWLDEPTQDVLAFVSRRIRHDPVVMISGLRDGHPVAISAADVIEINLPALDAESSRVLLAMSGDLTPADQRAVLSQAEGNPLALVELPTAWRSAGIDIFSSGPASVPLTTRLEHAFAARITELPPLTRDALLVAAVNATESLAEILAGTAILAGVGVSTECLEPAAESRLVAFDHVGVRFRHPLVRSGVLYNERLRRRQAAHAAMSEVLRFEPYRQVWHQAQSVDGPDDDVAARLDDSHVESIRRGSVLSAITALQRSAQLTSDPETRARRLLLAAQHAFGLGRADLVHRLVDAAEINDLSDLDQARAEWLRELFSEGKLGDSARVRELCALATRSAESGGLDLALDLLSSAALRCWWAVSDQSERAHVASTAESLTEAAADPRRTYAMVAADPLGRARQTRIRLETITAEGVSNVDQLRQLGMAARAAGADPLAADYFNGAESKLRERGQLGLLSQLLAVQAAVCLDLGNWRRAGQSLEEGRQLAKDTDQSTWRTGTVVVEAVYEGLTGDTDPALRHAAEVEAACAGQVAGDFRSLVQLARGTAHLSEGRHAAAYAALAPIFDPLGPCHHPREQLSAVMFLVEAAVGCGATEAVRAVVARLETLAETTQSPILGVHLLYARPMLAKNADAERLFQLGLAQDLTRWPWPRARIELAYGNWLRLGRRPAESRVLLRSALATFEVLGARGWARQARAGLRAAGEQIPIDGAETQASTLTPQEMQIARLVASGLSNREIGQQLYLSPRTIGSHLYRIFPKLGISSRAQLASRMSDL